MVKDAPVHSILAPSRPGKDHLYVMVILFQEASLTRSEIEFPHSDKVI
jgi:hypothetical protein